METPRIEAEAVELAPAVLGIIGLSELDKISSDDIGVGDNGRLTLLSITREAEADSIELYVDEVLISPKYRFRQTQLLRC